MFCFLQPRPNTEPTWIKLSTTTSVNISASVRLTDFHQQWRSFNHDETWTLFWLRDASWQKRQVCLIKGELPVSVVVHPTNLQICSVFLSMDAKKKTWRQIVADKVKFVSNYLNWQQTTLTLTSWIRLTVTISELIKLLLTWSQTENHAQRDLFCPPNSPFYSALVSSISWEEYLAL